MLRFFISRQDLKTRTLRFETFHMLRWLHISQIGCASFYGYPPRKINQCSAVGWRLGGYHLTQLQSKRMKVSRCNMVFLFSIKQKAFTSGCRPPGMAWWRVWAARETAGIMPRPKGFSGVWNQNGCQITGLLRGGLRRYRFLITSPIIIPAGCIRLWGIKPRLPMRKNYAVKRLKIKFPFLLDRNNEQNNKRSTHEASGIQVRKWFTSISTIHDFYDLQGKRIYPTK